MGPGETFVRAWFAEAWNRQDAGGARRLCGENVVLHNLGLSGESLNDVSAFLEFQTMLLAAFPDMTFTVEHIVESGDFVATRWSAAMTHQRAWMGKPASGRKLTLTGISFVRMGTDGRPAESWDEWDRFGLLQQIDGASDVDKVARAK
jgi:steroid delta-isomerase-like uncharacterized protein